MIFSSRRRQGPERWQSYEMFPDRRIPLLTRLGLLFSGFFNLFGWFFFGFGMLFVWIFGGTGYLRDLAHFSGPLGTTPAAITAVQETSVSINDRRVYEYQFEYIVDDREYTASTDGFHGRYRPGDTARVEYPLNDPARARIIGLDTGLGGWPFLFTLIFPLVGLGFIVFGFRKGLQGQRLLVNGRQAVGRFVSREITNTRINNRPVYKYNFDFEAADGRTYQASGRSHLPDRFAGEENLEMHRKHPDDILEPLVYNPANPADAVMLDDLPASPRIRDDGLVYGGGVATAVSLLLPGLVIAGNLLWILHVLEIP